MFENYISLPTCINILHDYNTMYDVYNISQRKIKYQLLTINSIIFIRDNLSEYFVYVIVNVSYIFYNTNILITHLFLKYFIETSVLGIKIWFNGIMQSNIKDKKCRRVLA